MNRPAFARLTLACVLLLLAASPGRADPIQWSEVWRAPSGIMADNGLGSVSLWQTGYQQSVSGSSNVVATNLVASYNPVFSNFPPIPLPGPVPGPIPLPPVPGPSPATPAVFNSDPFKLILFIKDADSGVVGSLTYQGVLNGSLTPTSSTLTATMTPPADTTLHLGHHLFRVTLDPSVRLGLPGDPAVSLTAQVTVTHNPEPSALVLAALGAPALALTLWRKRRRSRR